MGTCVRVVSICYIMILPLSVWMCACVDVCARCLYVGVLMCTCFNVCVDERKCRCVCVRMSVDRVCTCVS